LKDDRPLLGGAIEDYPNRVFYLLNEVAMMQSHEISNLIDIAQLSSQK